MLTPGLSAYAAALDVLFLVKTTNFARSRPYFDWIFIRQLFHTPLCLLVIVGNFFDDANEEILVIKNIEAIVRHHSTPATKSDARNLSKDLSTSRRGYGYLLILLTRRCRTGSLSLPRLKPAS